MNSGRNDPSHTWLLPTPQYLYNHPYEEQGYYYYVKLFHLLFLFETMFLNMNIMSIAIGVINTMMILSKSPIWLELELSPSKPYYGQEHHNHHAFSLSYLHFNQFHFHPLFICISITNTMIPPIIYIILHFQNFHTLLIDLHLILQWKINLKSVKMCPKLCKTYCIDTYGPYKML